MQKKNSDSISKYFWFRRSLQVVFICIRAWKCCFVDFTSVNFSIDVIVWLANQSSVLVKVACFLRVKGWRIRFGGFCIPGDALFFCIPGMVWELLLEEVG